MSKVPNKLLTESDLNYIDNVSGFPNPESLLNSLLMIRYMVDNESKKYSKYHLVLTDNKPVGGTSFKVTSNSVGKTIISNLVSSRNNTYDGGSESETSQYISYYSESI